jgi:hypothetical protein
MSITSFSSDLMMNDGFVSFMKHVFNIKVKCMCNSRMTTNKAPAAWLPICHWQVNKAQQQARTLILNTEIR